jgi:hypothetical protein
MLELTLGDVLCADAQAPETCLPIRRETNTRPGGGRKLLRLLIDLVSSQQGSQQGYDNSSDLCYAVYAAEASCYFCPVRTEV